MLQYNIMLNILAAPASIFGDIKCVLHGTRCDEVFLPVGTKGLCILVRRQIYKVTSCSEVAARGSKQRKKDTS
jgi:hypothetical protein